MTAKEFIFNKFPDIKTAVLELGLAINVLTDDELLETMEQYALSKKSEWCKEQREICARSITDSHSRTGQRAILRAIKQVYDAPDKI